VTDLYGTPLPGIPVTFSLPAGAPTATFQRSGTNVVVAITGDDGVADSGPIMAGATPGTFSAAVSYGDAIAHSEDVLTIGAPPSFSGAALPAALAGVPYSAPGQVSGSSPVTLSLVAGALPPGLALDGTGISGTPTTAGSYRCTLRAANAYGSATRASTLKVAGGATISLKAQAGVRSVAVRVPLIGDAIVEPDETVVGTLSASTLWPIKTATATGTIRNDD
jgi:hypothetical protein